jgi:hypothetical protein
MNTRAKLFILIVSAQCAGCYVGSNFIIEASHLEQPVSFSPAIHNDELQVVGPGNYNELGRFSISFTEWSFGAPISPNPSKDISGLLNEVVKQKGGNGITRFTFKVENSTLNTFSMFLKGLSYTTLVIGAAMLLGDSPNKSTGAVVAGASLAGVLLLPTAAHFTVEGTIIMIDKKKN